MKNFPGVCLAAGAGKPLRAYPFGKRTRSSLILGITLR